MVSPLVLGAGLPVPTLLPQPAAAPTPAAPSSARSCRRLISDPAIASVLPLSTHTPPQDRRRSRLSPLSPLADEARRVGHRPVAPVGGRPGIAADRSGLDDRAGRVADDAGEHLRRPSSLDPVNESVERVVRLRAGAS